MRSKGYKTAPKSARSSSKPTTPLNQVRGAIGERENWGTLRKALIEVKVTSSPTEFSRLFNLASISRLNEIAFPSSKAIKKLGRIQAVKPLDTASLIRELNWTAMVLIRNQKLIETFILHRRNFITALLRGKHDEAHAAITAVNEECGVSLWAIENQIALKSLNSGFEPTKSYISDITATSKRTFSAFFANSIGERNENRVSRASYEKRLKEKIVAWKIEPAHETYILYKLIAKPPASSNAAADILAYEAASSPVDLYETYLHIISCISELEPQIHRLDLLASSIPAFDDPRLDVIKSIIRSELPLALESPPYIEKYLKGCLDDALMLAADYLRAGVADPLPTIVIAKIVVRGRPIPAHISDFQTRMIEALRDYLLLGSGNDDAAQALERIALNFRCLPIAECISTILDETSAHYIGDIPRAIASKITATDDFSPLLVLHKNIGLLQLQRYNHNLLLHSYLHLSHGSTDERVQIVELHNDAEAYARLSNARSNDDFVEAFAQLSNLQSSNHAYVRQEAYVLKAWIHLLAGELFEAITITVQLAVSNQALLRALPLSAIFSKRSFRDLKFLEKELSLSIGFYLYASLTRENTKDVALKVAWKQFHKANGVDIPSSLLKKKDSFQKEELIYFLRNVCTQEIMELSAFFNSPADLDRERLQICISLSELDPENSAEHNSEIIELTRRLSIEAGVQQVESSRVYVDLLGLQRWCHNNLNETFLRYQDYTKAGLNASSEELERSILALLRKSGMNIDVVNFLDSYDISSESLLAELIEDIASSFLTLPRFGLDAFLGSRVRHGSLEGAFRSRLEERHLITKIDSKSNQYESNRHWLDGVVFKSKEQRANVDRILSNFSKNIDAIIDAAITRYVYVQSAANSEGLIALWPSDERNKRNLLKGWIAAVKLEMTDQATIEQLVDYCASTMFWPTLRQSLVNAADYVKDNLANQIHLELDNLAAAIMAQTKQLPMLLTTIEVAKSDVVGAAATVAKWFAPPQFTDVVSTYLLKTGMEVGITSLQHRYPRFKPDIDWNVDAQANVLLQPRAFEVINDASFLIFGNIRQHSGYFVDARLEDASPVVQISISSREGAFVDVEVLSGISPNIDLGQIRQNVGAAKERIARGEFDSVAQKRKNTGLVRLASTLNYEQATDKTTDFGLTNDGQFRVYFSVPTLFLTGKPNE